MSLPLGTVDYASIALGGILVGLLAAFGYRLWKASRIRPEERERRRRVALAATGKLGDAALVEFRESLIFYSYEVRGVVYTASQDLSSLTPLIPPNLSEAGAASVKYDPKNPANSIIASETWMGLRAK